MLSEQDPALSSGRSLELLLRMGLESDADQRAPLSLGPKEGETVGQSPSPKKVHLPSKLPALGHSLWSFTFSYEGLWKEWGKLQQNEERGWRKWCLMYIPTTS